MGEVPVSMEQCRGAFPVLGDPSQILQCQINQSIQTAAPGSAPIIEAQADAWLVRANAYTQAATADLMRLRAIDLANSSADIKMGATNTTNLRQQLMNLLQHN